MAVHAVTVDAPSDRVGFYQRCDFIHLPAAIEAVPANLNIELLPVASRTLRKAATVGLEGAGLPAGGEPAFQGYRESSGRLVSSARLRCFAVMPMYLVVAMNTW